MKELYEYCPRFSRCSVNKCPLDSSYPNREMHPGDKEKRCKVGKEIRIKIHEEHNGNLKYKGMKQREHTAHMRWQSLSEDEKQRIRQETRTRLKGGRI